MKRFQFRHQTLLDVAAQRERTVQIELARAQAAETEARRQLEQTLHLWSEWEGRIRESQKGRIEPRLLRELLHASETLRQRAGRERELLRAAERQAEAVRERLKEAATARKSYERLRERLHAEYQTEDTRQQVQVADDTASVRVATARTSAAAPEVAGRRDRHDASQERSWNNTTGVGQSQSGLTTGVSA
jgi:flagellar export protein FliJ